MATLQTRGPMIRLANNTVAALNKPSEPIVGHDGVLNDQAYQFLQSVGQALNNIGVSNNAGDPSTIATLQTQVNESAALDSPIFTGDPQAPTAPLHTNTTQLATTQFVENEFKSPLVIGATAANSAAFTTLQATDTKTTTLEATGLITPSTTAGLLGTTLADNANAGSVGEYIEQVFGATSLTSNTAASLGSISLDGDWDVTGNILYNVGTGSSASAFYGGINTSVAFPSAPRYAASSVVTPASGFYSIFVPQVRVNASVATNTNLLAQATFTGTVTAQGIIMARRRR